MNNFGFEASLGRLFSMHATGGYHRVSIVFDPASGRGRALQRATGLAKVLQSMGHRPVLAQVGKMPWAEIAASLRASDAVVVVGGDGLVHGCLPHLIDLGIPLGTIPAGGGNDAWRMSGLSTATASKDLVVRFLQGDGRIRPVDVLELNFDNEPDATRYVLGAVSCGVEARINAKANGLPRWMPGTRYAVALFLSIWNLNTCRWAIRSEDFSWEGHMYVGSISNIRTLGGGFKLFPEAQDDDGLADLMLVIGRPRHEVLPRLGSILAGRGHPYRKTARLQSATVDFAGTSYGDGEALGCGPFTLAVRPGSLALMN